jgi:hypothetical protein
LKVNARRHSKGVSKSAAKDKKWRYVFIFMELIPMILGKAIKLTYLSRYFIISWKDFININDIICCHLFIFNYFLKLLILKQMGNSRDNSAISVLSLNYSATFVSPFEYYAMDNWP